MGLNGRLEDLPLLDIVQVVAYSQKTGYLTVETPRGDAAIVFEKGLVVSSFTPDTRPSIPRPAPSPRRSAPPSSGAASRPRSSSSSASARAASSSA